MLLLCRSTTGIGDKPGVEASVESRSCSRVTAAVRHHPTHHQSLDALLFQDVGEVGVQEGIICILVDDAAPVGGFGNVGHQLPVRRAFCDGARWSPFLDELIFEGWRELFRGVTVLGKDARHGMGFEMGIELENVGKAVVGHGGKNGLHVNDKEDRLHPGQIYVCIRQ